MASATLKADDLESNRDDYDYDDSPAAHGSKGGKENPRKENPRIKEKEKEKMATKVKEKVRPMSLTRMPLLTKVAPPMEQMPLTGEKMITPGTKDGTQTHMPHNRGKPTTIRQTTDMEGGITPLRTTCPSP